MTVKEDYKVMTIKDLKKQLNSETYAEIEVYRFKDKSKRVHTDFIEFVDEWNEDMLLVNEWSYELMDEDKYSHTILINDAI